MRAFPRLRSTSLRFGHFALALGGVLAVRVAASSGGTEIWWAAPERFQVTPGATLVVQVQTAPEFSGDGTPIPVERIAQRSGVLANAPLLPGNSVPPTAPAAVPAQSVPPARWNVTLPRPGVAFLTADLLPIVRVLGHDQVDAYLRDVYAGEELRQAWAALPTTVRWREKLRVRLKTCIRVGEPPDFTTVAPQSAPVGLDLRIETDPTNVRVGSTVPVRIVQNGSPVAGLLVGFVAHGLGREHVVATDAEGRAAAPCDAAGLWMVGAHTLRPNIAGGEADWDAETVVFTFAVH